MTNVDCDRGHEALDILGAGRWPDGCDAELRAHVAACASCTELVDVAGAVLDERNTALRDAAIPGSGLVWWRIQLRVRQEKARSASRTVTAVQAIAIAVAVTIALALVGATSLSWSRGWLAGLTDAIPLGATDPSGLSIIPFALPILLVLAAWLALGPVVLWLAATDD